MSSFKYTPDWSFERQYKGIICGVDEAGRGPLAGPVIAAAVIFPREIDRINILQASLIAMKRAIFDLPIKPDAALIDGNKLPPLSMPCKAIVKGDARSFSIAAASIVAKLWCLPHTPL